MAVSLKALIVVLGLSMIVFAMAKSTALQFMEKSDFDRRRNIWLILTVTAFLSPNIWIFTLFAAPLLYWGGKRDTHPLAFYLLLINVIPPISREIPTVLVNRLFDLNILRLLSFCVLIPAAWRIRKSADTGRAKGYQAMDLLLMGYGALQVFLYVSPDPATTNNIILHSSFTNDLRTAFLFFVDTYVLYYVASRSCRKRAASLDAIAAYVLSCSIMALTAIFESVKHWLLYADLFARWGGNLMNTAYYVRAGLLRAEASSGQPLALAYLLAVAFGLWLYLRSRVQRSFGKSGITILLLLGLLVSFSRGPWLAALTIFLAYSTFRARRPSSLFKASIIVLLLGGLVLLSPIGPRIARMLPIPGQKGADSSLIYREKLLDRSWQLIKAHPVLGDQVALSEMQDLRQGQGIIDVVNTYLGVTLYYGFTGLGLFVAFQLLPIFRVRRTIRRLLESDPDSVLLGAALSATLVGTIILLAASSLLDAPRCLFFVLVGIADAYWFTKRSEASDALSSATSHVLQSTPPNLGSP